jgi:hypothetical protein
VTTHTPLVRQFATKAPIFKNVPLLITSNVKAVLRSDSKVASVASYLYPRFLVLPDLLLNATRDAYLTPLFLSDCTKVGIALTMVA